MSVEKSSLSLEASYVDTETILLRFDTSATAYYSGPNDLVSGIQVDGIPVKSAYIPAQIRSVTTLDSTIPDLDFLIDFSQFGFSDNASANIATTYIFVSHYNEYISIFKRG